MESRSELMTVSQLYEVLTKCVNNGYGDKFIQVNEYFVGYEEEDEEQFGIGEDQILLSAIHVQDIIEYGEETGDEIDC